MRRPPPARTTIHGRLPCSSTESSLRSFSFPSSAPRAAPRASSTKGAIYLDPDGLFFLSLLAGPPTFTDYAGKLDAQGTAYAYIRIPCSERLIGVCLCHAGVAYDRTGVNGRTNTKGTVITR